MLRNYRTCMELAMFRNTVAADSVDSSHRGPTIHDDLGLRIHALQLGCMDKSGSYHRLGSYGMLLSSVMGLLR